MERIWIYFLGFIIILALIFSYKMWPRFNAFFAAAYPNARYSAMGNEFVTRSGTARVLASKGLPEAVSAATTRDFTYRESEIDSLDQDLDNHMIQVLDMVKTEMPKPTLSLFETFLLRYEIKTLKRILRALFNGSEWSSDPVGGLDRKTLQLLKQVEDLQDIQYILRFTSYNEVMKNAFRERVPEVHELDDALDKFYADHMVSTSEGVKVWKRPYREYLSVYSDIQNIKLALRVREMRGEFDPAKIITLGKGVGVWELEQIVNSETFEEAVRHLQGTNYEIVARNIFEGEKELDRQLLRLTGDLAIRYINTAGPSLHFVQAREFEIRNLRKIFRGINEGLPAKEIESELIIID